MSEAVLEVSRLTKKIGNQPIVKDISFEIGPGEIFGFLGPNGSGKTTTIRMLVDLIRPSSGSIRIGGYDVHRQHDLAMAKVGCIVENPELYDFMTGWENLQQLAAMIPGLPTSRIDEVAQIVGMGGRLHDKVKNYSLGMKQRLGIAQALLNRPQLLILDEPTNGLDPQGIKELRAFIRSLAAGGMSLFISSHLLSEIQLLCDRVAIIRSGRLVAVGTVAALLEHDSHRVVITIAAQQSERIWAWIQQSGYDGQPVGASDYDDNSGQWAATDAYAQFSVSLSTDQLPAFHRQLAATDIAIYEVAVKPPSLEELFLKLTEGETID